MQVSAAYPPIPTPTPETPTPPPTMETTPGPGIIPTSLPEIPPAPGGICVTSFPSGATIYLDGRGYGITPNCIQNLTPRSYELRLSLVGWKDYITVVSVSPGQTTREDATLLVLKRSLSRMDPEEKGHLHLQPECGTIPDGGRVPQGPPR